MKSESSPVIEKNAEDTRTREELERRLDEVSDRYIRYAHDEAMSVIVEIMPMTGALFAEVTIWIPRRDAPADELNRNAIDADWSY